MKAPLLAIAALATATAALAEVGAGAGASPLLGGHMEDHEALEGEIASWLGAEAALLFGSGWHANVGVVSALVGWGCASTRPKSPATVVHEELASAPCWERESPHDEVRLWQGI